MHVITRKRLIQFGQSYPDAMVPLEVWYQLMKKGRFNSAGAIKEVFGSADFLGDRLVVFNIGGNKYRLVANIIYATATNLGRVYIRHVFTHREYDRWSDQRRGGHK